MVYILYKTGEKKLVILHIYEARDIFPYLIMTKILNVSNGNDHISTNLHPLKKSKVLWKNDIHNLQNGRKYCGNYPYLWG